MCTEQLRGFWQEQYREIEQVPADAQEFKNHQLPLARIKKVCQSASLLGWGQMSGTVRTDSCCICFVWHQAHVNTAPYLRDAPSSIALLDARTSDAHDSACQPGYCTSRS